jgi:hypothetical protein
MICEGECGRDLPYGTEIAEREGRGKGREAYERNEALGMCERCWNWFCKECFAGNRHAMYEKGEL